MNEVGCNFLLLYHLLALDFCNISILEASLSISQIHPWLPHQDVSVVPIQCCHLTPFNGLITKEESQEFHCLPFLNPFWGKVILDNFFPPSAQSIVSKNSSFFCQVIRLQISACWEWIQMRCWSVSISWGFFCNKPSFRGIYYESFKSQAKMDSELPWLAFPTLCFDVLA